MENLLQQKTPAEINADRIDSVERGIQDIKGMLQGNKSEVVQEIDATSEGIARILEMIDSWEKVAGLLIIGAVIFGVVWLVVKLVKHCKKVEREVTDGNGGKTKAHFGMKEFLDYNCALEEENADALLENKEDLLVMRWILAEIAGRYNINYDALRSKASTRMLKRRNEKMKEREREIRRIVS